MKDSIDNIKTDFDKLKTQKNPTGLTPADLDMVSNEEYEEILLNYVKAGDIPIDSVGDMSYFLPSVEGGFAAGTKQVVVNGSVTCVENDGTIVTLGNMTNGSEKGVYYNRFKIRPDMSLETNEPAPGKYENAFTKLHGVDVRAIVGCSNGYQYFITYGVMNGAEVYTLVLTNGTLDSSQHKTAFIPSEQAGLNYSYLIHKDILYQLRMVNASIEISYCTMEDFDNAGEKPLEFKPYGKDITTLKMNGSEVVLNSVVKIAENWYVRGSSVDGRDTVSYRSEVLSTPWTLMPVGAGHPTENKIRMIFTERVHNNPGMFGGENDYKYYGLSGVLDLDTNRFELDPECREISTVFLVNNNIVHKGPFKYTCIYASWGHNTPGIMYHYDGYHARLWGHNDYDYQIQMYVSGVKNLSQFEAHRFNNFTNIARTITSGVKRYFPSPVGSQVAVGSCYGREQLLINSISTRNISMSIKERLYSICHIPKGEPDFSYGGTLGFPPNDERVLTGSIHSTTVNYDIEKDTFSLSTLTFTSNIETGYIDFYLNDKHVPVLEHPVKLSYADSRAYYNKYKSNFNPPAPFNDNYTQVSLVVLDKSKVKENETFWGLFTIIAGYGLERPPRVIVSRVQLTLKNGTLVYKDSVPEVILNVNGSGYSATVYNNIIGSNVRNSSLFIKHEKGYLISLAPNIIYGFIGYDAITYDLLFTLDLEGNFVYKIGKPSPGHERGRQNVFFLHDKAYIVNTTIINNISATGIPGYELKYDFDTWGNAFGPTRMILTQQVSESFKVYITSKIPIIKMGSYHELPPSVIDLTKTDSNPKNKFFSLYIKEMSKGVFDYVISSGNDFSQEDDDTIPLAIIETGETKIKDISIVKTARLKGYRFSVDKEPNVIPISEGSVLQKSNYDIWYKK